jgi:predicted metalloprotease with PDZ domain
VANSIVDSNHAYLIPEASFLYPDGQLQVPIRVTILTAPGWTRIATGLDTAAGKAGVFTAPDYDILYDCPILAGPLEELPSFNIRGIKHRFIGYRLGDFDRVVFMDQLQKVVAAGINIIGDIPYKQYTFIAIGPGRGGIEHLNNTTISFDGNRLGTPEAMNGIMNFLAHEYFHHYNVKRIRPFELGPFDYERGSRTNLLWVSEGLSVYYEHLMVHRAGLTDRTGALSAFARHLNQVENNPGRHFQSLVQASYDTWSDGPFGTGGDDPGKTISYYEKGPLIGLLLDFAIREATGNARSLDDVMRLLYRKYYQEAGRGFTDAEFQQACENVAGTSLATIFEYVYTTKDPDYNRWLKPGGLQVTPAPGEGAKMLYTLSPVEHPDAQQQKILESWLGAGK